MRIHDLGFGRIFNLVAVFVASTAESRAPAQRIEPDLKVEVSPNTGLASFVTSAAGGLIPVEASKGATSALAFLNTYGHLFGVQDSAKALVQRRTTIDWLGGRHTTFDQVYRGVPVFSGILKVHEDAQGNVYAANGHFYPIKPTLDPTPLVTLPTAIATASEELQAAQPIVQRSELVIVDPGWYGDPPKGPRLAYHMVLIDPTVPLVEGFFVDAKSGAILDQWSQLHTALDRRIHDGNGTPTLPGSLVRMEGDPPVATPEDVNRAYDYFGDVHGYFDRAFGRDSIDGIGLPLIATVNSTAPGCPNAFWDGDTLQMVFCGGTVTDDIVAHEMTHGLTQFTANLFYQNQSGQLNESCSDVFGELIDLFNGDAAFVDSSGGGPLWPTHPTGSGTDQPNGVRTDACSLSPDYADGVRWLMGEDALVFGGAIRDMRHPTCFGDPDYADSPLQTCPSFDSGGVHSGSGIPNHAFALATDGGTFRGYSIQAVGPIKAGAVWYRALTTYLSVASDFRDAYSALNQAAADLIGSAPDDPRNGRPSADIFTPFDADEIDKALLAVGLNGEGGCGKSISILDSTPPLKCHHAATIFADDFEAGNVGWTVFHSGPLGPPTPYDWVLTTEPLPFSRSGTAWFCEDLQGGDCSFQNEIGLHSLVSPPIAIPKDARFPVLSFSHYLATEPGYDGGLILIRINGGAWVEIPSNAFEFNPYNALMQSSREGSTNPLGGRAGWSGVGGRWGTSVVDLGRFLGGGDVLEIRFDFGKDGCVGVDGWYVDDVMVVDCPDCNENGHPDHLDVQYTATSGLLGPLTGESPQVFRLAGAPRASEDVELTVYASADLGNGFEWISLEVNGNFIARLFEPDGADCPLTPNQTRVLVPAGAFNLRLNGEDPYIELIPQSFVDTCSSVSFAQVVVKYVPVVADSNSDGVPDECESCIQAEVPMADPNHSKASRYLSIVAGSAGRSTALRVTLVASADFHQWVGSRWWVASPAKESNSTGGGLIVSRLTCQPVYRNWGTDGILHIGDAGIVPNSLYEVDAIDLPCEHDGVQNFSLPVRIATTTNWGDLTGGMANEQWSPPDGRVDFTDIALAVDCFRQIPPAIDLRIRCDLSLNHPAAVVDFADIGAVVDSFHAGTAGGPFPFLDLKACD